MTPQQMVQEFHRVFDCTVDSRDVDTVTHRMDLIFEEYEEVQESLMDMLAGLYNDYPMDDHLPDVSKELADLVYVLYGTAVALGIDLDEAVRLVHESNMTKVWPDGKPRVREDGKILKPPTYQKPDMRPTVKEL